MTSLPSAALMLITGMLHRPTSGSLYSFGSRTIEFMCARSKVPWTGSQSGSQSDAMNVLEVRCCDSSYTRGQMMRFLVMVLSGDGDGSACPRVYTRNDPHTRCQRWQASQYNNKSSLGDLDGVHGRKKQWQHSSPK